MKKKIKKPKASILIASYNNSKYLKRCLDTALNQSYTNKEIIVLDDNSKDNSLEILKKYKKKIKLVKKKSKYNVGSYDQQQSYYECFKLSRGEIIFFLDSDDYFSKKKLSTVINEFQKKKKIKVIYDLPTYTFSKYKRKFRLKNSILNNYWSNVMPTSCISVRRIECRKIFKRMSFKRFPDIWFDFRLNIFTKYLKLGNLYLDQNLTYYRQTNTNVSFKFQHLSKNWWMRREQAHEFIKFFFKKCKIRYNKNFDYYLTKIINYLI